MSTAPQNRSSRHPPPWYFSHEQIPSCCCECPGVKAGTNNVSSGPFSVAASHTPALLLAVSMNTSGGARVESGQPGVKYPVVVSWPTQLSGPQWQTARRNACCSQFPPKSRFDLSQRRRDGGGRHCAIDDSSSELRYPHYLRAAGAATTAAEVATPAATLRPGRFPGASSAPISTVTAWLTSWRSAPFIRVRHRARPTSRRTYRRLQAHSLRQR